MKARGALLLMLGVALLLDASCKRQTGESAIILPRDRSGCGLGEDWRYTDLRGCRPVEVHRRRCGTILESWSAESVYGGLQVPE